MRPFVPSGQSTESAYSMLHWISFKAELICAPIWSLRLSTMVNPSQSLHHSSCTRLSSMVLNQKPKQRYSQLFLAPKLPTCTVSSRMPCRQVFSVQLEVWLTRLAKKRSHFWTTSVQGCPYVVVLKDCMFVLRNCIFEPCFLVCNGN